MTKQPVKALSPEEVRKAGEVELIPEVRHMVEEVNKGLIAGSRTFAASLFKNQKIGAAVADHFRKAGWNVDYKSDQREGDYYRFNG